MQRSLLLHLQEDDTLPDDVHLIAEVQSLRNRRLLRTLAMVQDLSDALMAINDVTGELAGRLGAFHVTGLLPANIP